MNNDDDLSIVTLTSIQQSSLECQHIVILTANIYIFQNIIGFFFIKIR